jgi:hypothetical protein
MCGQRLQLGQKPVGTMAHALVMAIAAIAGSEADAFDAFHRYFPGAPLLIDTYDTVAAARYLAEHQQSGQPTLAGVRLDSGDLPVSPNRCEHCCLMSQSLPAVTWMNMKLPDCSKPEPALTVMVLAPVWLPVHPSMASIN